MSVIEARIIDGNIHVADIHDADIHEADIHDADIHEADIHEADIHEADIHEADIQYGDIQDGDIQDGDIQDGDVHDADKLPIAVVIEPQIVIDAASSSINEGYIELKILSKRMRVLAILDLILNLILTIYNLIRVVPAMLCYLGFEGARMYNNTLIFIYYLYTVLNIAGSLIYAITIIEDRARELILYIPLLIIQLITLIRTVEFKKAIANLTDQDIRCYKE